MIQMVAAGGAFKSTPILGNAVLAIAVSKAPRPTATKTAHKALVSTLNEGLDTECGIKKLRLRALRFDEKPSKALRLEFYSLWENVLIRRDNDRPYGGQVV